MKKFVKNVCKLLVICSVVTLVVVLFDWCIVGNQFSMEYEAALRDKIQRLCTVKSPKIILIGNSNVAFSIDSEMIEKSFGMPVVNLGLHGALGNKFHENMAKGNIKSGDIVIICHSTYSDDGRLSDPVLVWAAVEKNIMNYDVFEKEDYLDMIKSYPKYFLKAAGRWTKLMVNRKNKKKDTCYARSSFNKHGDIVYRPAHDYREVDALGQSKHPEINDICVNRINRYNEYVDSCGGTLLIAGYPIGYGKEKPSKKWYSDFTNELQKNVHCVVISDFSDYFFEAKYHFNGFLHLNDVGAKLRTKLFINDLRRWEDRRKLISKIGDKGGMI